MYFDSATVEAIASVTVAMPESADRLRKKLQTLKNDSKRVETLIALSSLSVSTPAQALRYAKQSLKILNGSPENLQQKGRIWISIAEATRELERYEESEHAFLHLLEIANQCADDDLRCLALAGLAGVHLLKGTYVIGKEYGERALEFARRRKHLSLAGILNTLGFLESINSNHVRALQLFEEAASIAHENHDPDRESAALGNIGSVFFSLSDYTRAIEYQKRAFHLASRSDKTDRAGKICVRIGASYLELKDYENAREWLAKARVHGEKKREQVYLKLNLGEMHLGFGRTYDAIREIQIALKLVIQIQHQPLLSATYFLLGRANRILGDNKQALQYLKQGLLIASQINYTSFQIKILEQLIDVYKSLGQYRNALDASIEYTALKSSLLAEEQHRKITQIQASMEIEQAQKARELAEKERQLLELEVGRKQEELSRTALELVQKGEYLRSVARQLQEVHEEVSGKAKKRVATLLSQARSLQAQNSVDWSRFEAQFAEAHSNFLETCAKLYPSLTNHELRLAVLLRLNLSSKDIARLLFVTEKNVEKRRARLRKKLGIRPGLNMVTFLSSLGSNARPVASVP